MRESSLCVFLFPSWGLDGRNQLLSFSLEVMYVFLLILPFSPNSRPLHPRVRHLPSYFLAKLREEGAKKSFQKPPIL